MQQIRKRRLFIISFYFVLFFRLFKQNGKNCIVMQRVLKVHFNFISACILRETASLMIWINAMHKGEKDLQRKLLTSETKA